MRGVIILAALLLLLVNCVFAQTEYYPPPPSSPPSPMPLSIPVLTPPPLQSETAARIQEFITSDQSISYSTFINNIGYNIENLVGPFGPTVGEGSEDVLEGQALVKKIDKATVALLSHKNVPDAVIELVEIMTRNLADPVREIVRLTQKRGFDVASAVDPLKRFIEKATLVLDAIEKFNNILDSENFTDASLGELDLIAKYHNSQLRSPLAQLSTTHYLSELALLNDDLDEFVTKLKPVVLEARGADRIMPSEERPGIIPEKMVEVFIIPAVKPSRSRDIRDLFVIDKQFAAKTRSALFNVTFGIEVRLIKNFFNEIRAVLNLPRRFIRGGQQ